MFEIFPNRTDSCVSSINDLSALTRRFGEKIFLSGWIIVSIRLQNTEIYCEWVKGHRPTIDIYIGGGRAIEFTNTDAHTDHWKSIQIIRDGAVVRTNANRIWKVTHEWNAETKAASLTTHHSIDHWTSQANVLRTNAAMLRTVTENKHFYPSPLSEYRIGCGEGKEREHFSFQIEEKIRFPIQAGKDKLILHGDAS